MMRARRTGTVRALLDQVFRDYHHPEFIAPDPLQFVHRYPGLCDREVVALLAAGLAYGQMKGILRSIQRILDPLGPHPARFVRDHTDQDVADRWHGFQHRWTRVSEVVRLVRAATEGQRAWGNLGARLAGQVRPGDTDLHPALQAWVGDLRQAGLPARHSMISDPGRGSACKRLYLMARWLVRQDEVDPGGWTGLAPALLLVPVDVHMHRMARWLGFTRRRAADLKTVREITAGFRSVDPDDPARFDFALTRLPLHDRLNGADVRRRLQAGLQEAGKPRDRSQKQTRLS